jgi:hypothetical protein
MFRVAPANSQFVGKPEADQSLARFMINRQSAFPDGAVPETCNALLAPGENCKTLAASVVGLICFPRGCAVWNLRTRSKNQEGRMIASLAPFSLFFFLIMPISYAAPEKPRADCHEHLLSPTVARIVGQAKPFRARDLIAEMDAAGIRRAVILSLAYQFGNPNRPPVEDEYTQVKKENDWTTEEVKQYPDRLVAFCGVDPLRDYALAEINRCSHDPYLKVGLKLHFGNSDVNLDNPEHVRKLRESSAQPTATTWRLWCICIRT